MTSDHQKNFRIFQGGTAVFFVETLILNFIGANVQADLNRLYIHVSKTNIYGTTQCFLGVTF